MWKTTLALDYIRPLWAHDVKRLQKAFNYIRVTKPWIVLANVVSTACGLILASRGTLDIPLMVSTLVGVSLVVASACTFNNCLDRDLDRKMRRTRGRVMAMGLISPRTAYTYGCLLAAAGLLLLRAASNLLCIAIVLAGLIIYVGVYTILLKPKTEYSVLIGSLAGAAPPLAGYCAVRGGFDMGAALLTIIFCLWQVPHCYALALGHMQDYRAAAIPVMSAKRGALAAKKRAIAYISAFSATVLLPTFAGYAGYVYLAAAAIVGPTWLAAAWWGYKTGDDHAWAARVFLLSIVSIMIVCAMLALDGKNGLVNADRQSPAGAVKSDRHLEYRQFRPTIQDIRTVYMVRSRAA